MPISKLLFRANYWSLSGNAMRLPLARSLGERCVLTLIISLSACDASSRESQFERATSATLHEVCDSALAMPSNPPVAERLLRVEQLGQIRLPDEIGRVGDVDVGAVNFFVLDAVNRRIVELSPTGEVLRVFGQSGEGPGDLSFPPPSEFGGARLATLGDSVLIAVDRRSTKAYDSDANVLWDVVLSTFYEGNNEGLHTADIGDGLVLFSESGRRRYQDTARAVRTSVNIKRLATSTRTAELAMTVSNPLVLREVVQKIPPQMPYDDDYRRVWDADADGLAIYSYRSYGVCFFDLSGHLRSAHSRGGQSYTVDDAEKSRVMTATFGTRHDVPLPVIRKSAIEYFAGKWPERGPFYTDIVKHPNHGALLLRRASATRVVGDLVSEDSGYLGTIELPAGKLPRRIVNSTAISVDNEEMLLLTYRWRSHDERDQ